jgi:hypothetical protein
MKYIVNEKIDKTITKQYQSSFSLEEDTLCLIEIIASAKSWWQNFKSSRSFFKDDDIFLFLDSQELTTSKNEKVDACSAWNGNELKGLEKTVLVVANLKAGKHVVDLKPNQTPYLKSITISKVEEVNKITYAPVSNNNPAQKSDGRPWLSYIILDLFITNISITAQANKNREDDDDIKLLINGEIQKNENKRAKKDWYWCGKVSKGENKTFSKDINAQTKQFNIDLYSDETPRLSKIEIGIKEPKRIPTVDNPLWTGDFNDDTEEILLARLIFGETDGEPREAKIWAAWSVINRTKANSWWPKTIRGVILQKEQYYPFRLGDPNFNKVTNPFNFKKVVDEKTRKSWYECYEVASDVISGKISNPTTATHFVAEEKNRASFEKNVVPKGKFLKKIGVTYFYWSPN